MTVDSTTTVAGTLSATGAVTASTTTSAINLGTSQTTGTLILGGTAQTGTITLGRATTSQTTDIQAGATASGNQKTINLGTGGLLGSRTLITVGSATAGAASTVFIPSPTNLLIGTATTTGTASQPLQVTGGAYVSDSVGIGTTNPEKLLHLVTSAVTPLIVQRTSTNNSAVEYRNTTSSMWAGLATNATGWGVGPTENVGVGAQILVTRTGGELLVGRLTATGTASQLLQVDGGAYVSGSVGIGTAIPQLRSSLHIFDANIRPSISAPTLVIDRDANATGDDYSYVEYSNSNLGSVYAGLTATNQFGISITNPGGAGHTPYVTFGPDQNVMRYHPLIIGTATTTGTASQPLQVTGGAYVSGSVGIGVTNPTGKFHIFGGITAVGGEAVLVVTSSDVNTIPATITTGDSNGILQVFGGGMGSGSRRGGQIDFVAGVAITDPGILIFRTGTATGGTSQPEVARFSSSGNLGIGSTNPTSKLTVQGNVLISGIATLGTIQISSGIITATTGVVTYYGDGSKLSGVSVGNVSITNDTSTNGTFYVGMVSTTSGNLANLNVSSTKLTFNPSTGNLVAGGTVTANSDERLKTNIKTIPNALEKVLSLRGVEYDRIDTGDHQIGVIAQEVEKIIPEVVYPKQPSPDYETKSVSYQNIVGLLIEAIKEQEKRILELERKLGEN